MGSDRQKELVVVRSLTESDLGLFASHRAGLRGRQRAININASVARRLLSPELFETGEATLDCMCIFNGATNRESRRLNKSQKNWRLGGTKIGGEAFDAVDCKDFMLIRSPESNDGTYPVTLTFIAREVDPLAHAGLVAFVERSLEGSMAVYEEGTSRFEAIAKHCPPPPPRATAPVPPACSGDHSPVPVPPMPSPSALESTVRRRTIREKVREPHILERMLKVAGDLSAPAQLRFMETVEQLASQLRTVLLETGGIVRIEKDHRAAWSAVAGKPIGFVDGGLANLSMLGSAPVAARVGGYVVTPGERGPSRERFIVLKQLIDELYAHVEGGVYEDTFPDVGALRDAARISIEAAGAVRMVSENPGIAWIMLHGSLVNPVSRYTDIMKDGAVRHRFPDFSDAALAELLPPESPPPQGRDRNFISVHLRQLQALHASSAVVCGVVEREGASSTVCAAVLDSLNDHAIRDLLPMPLDMWKDWFRKAIDPSGDDDGMEGQRITDSLLFRCVLEPGEALAPVSINRNVLRKAPRAWQTVIAGYPKPVVSYMQTTEWTAPIRIEMFAKDAPQFREAASLVLHCALLLPNYAFPVGLDIVDKFAKIPDWMSRPVNTRTAVLALKNALDSGDARLFDALRRMLCGSGREWLLRPGIFR
ncbi:DNA double-strand break repair nuclease NurA [Azospirillum sp. sgz302134]